MMVEKKKNEFQYEVSQQRLINSVNHSDQSINQWLV